MCPKGHTPPHPRTGRAHARARPARGCSIILNNNTHTGKVFSMRNVESRIAWIARLTVVGCTKQQIATLLGMRVSTVNELLKTAHARTCISRLHALMDSQAAIIGIVRLLTNNPAVTTAYARAAAEWLEPHRIPRKRRESGESTPESGESTPDSPRGFTRESGETRARSRVRPVSPRMGHTKPLKRKHLPSPE